MLPRSHATDELALMSEFNAARIPLQKAKIGLLPNALSGWPAPEIDISRTTSEWAPYAG